MERGERRRASNLVSEVVAVGPVKRVVVLWMGGGEGWGVRRKGKRGKQGKRRKKGNREGRRKKDKKNAQNKVSNTSIDTSRDKQTHQKCIYTLQINRT
jgi:hypothetical protein